MAPQAAFADEQEVDTPQGVQHAFTELSVKHFSFGLVVCLWFLFCGIVLFCCIFPPKLITGNYYESFFSTLYICTVS